MKIGLLRTFILSGCLLAVGCQSADEIKNNVTTTSCLSALSANTEWSQETEVAVDGFASNMMEPKITSDQVVLFFNNKTNDDTQMDIHYAVKQMNGRYQYVAAVPGTVAASALDGVPAVDQAGNFYFTSLRDYTTTFQTLFSGVVAVTGPGTLQINSVASTDSTISLKTLGTVDMDMDVSWNGQWAVVSRAQFSGNPYPDASRLIMFQVAQRQLMTYPQSETILAQINALTTSGNCRLYAPNLSDDLKELYFTVLEPKPNDSQSFNFAILVAKRNNTSQAFAAPQVISAIQGVGVEGPSISFDDSAKTLFYHKFDSVTSRFKIYKVTRP